MTSLLDKRIKELVRHRYTKRDVTHEDLMPKQIRLPESDARVKTIDYIIDRTWNRPRDLIEFFNTCIGLAEGNTMISKAILMDAEGEYSRRCLRTIAEEWHGEFPNLPTHLKKIIAHKKQFFELGEITNETIMNWCIEVEQLINSYDTKGGKETDKLKIGRLEELASRYVNNNNPSEESIRTEVVSAFHRVGAIGIKLQKSESVIWADTGHGVSPAEYTTETLLHVHPALWRVLGIELKT